MSPSEKMDFQWWYQILDVRDPEIWFKIKRNEKAMTDSANVMLSHLEIG
jgi:hypothetical protein